ncbi:uncharacterized protein LOC131215210 [Anopheles bellator]|uniref:uncharacterized protein LOC131215210 n=1 Tax=Anopheles bellator TaxID=139047 RepID=UPI002649ED0A|nr:uncharacterized protein LOC131215210 [Anopheles bellator]
MTSSMSPASGAEGGSGGGAIKTSNRLSLKRRSQGDAVDVGSRETWISTNKILNSSYSGRRINSRNPNFDYEETKLLISLWGDPQVQKTLITTHKKHPVIAELARKMREQNYNRSTEEINTRIKNLKCFYNRIKKDMAAGIINQTTWRHYADMDEIISRPVFGNAQRAHLMQQLRGQQDEESSKRQPEQDSPDQLHRFPVKLELMSDDDDDATEIRAEDLLTIDANFPEDIGGGVGKTATGSSRNLLAVRGENPGRNSGGRAANGRKRQHDDVEDEEDDDEDEEEDDDEGSDFDVENEFNDGLDEILQKAQEKTNGPVSKAGSSITVPPCNPVTSKTPNPSGLVIETVSSGSGNTISASSSNGPTPGKISVVPTNLLLKTPTAPSSLNTPIQIFTQPTVSIAAGGTGKATMNIATTAAGSSGAPMKLLLVNTVGKDGTTKQILTPASEVPAMPKLLPAPLQQAKVPISITPKAPIVSIPAVNVPKKPTTVIGGLPGFLKTGGLSGCVGGNERRSGGGFKTLLTQLVTIQRENLALNRERLALEKERLEFETKFGGSFVSMVQNMSSFFSGMLKHQRQEQQTTTATGNQLAAKPLPHGEPPLRAKSAEAVNDCSPDVRELLSSPSPASNSPALGVSRQLAEELTKEKSSPITTTATQVSAPPATKHPENSGPPAMTPSPLMKLNAELAGTEDNVTLPKKRRMMTRNSSQHSTGPPKLTPATSTTADESLKAELISDNDDH